LETNKQNASEALTAYAEKILEIKNALSSGHFEKLEDNFLRGNKTRTDLERGKNLAYPFYEVIAQIPDKPGSILEALNPLAEKGINIRDIELIKVREGIGGTLLLAFKTETDAKTAIELLEDKGIYAKRRV